MILWECFDKGCDQINPIQHTSIVHLFTPGTQPVEMEIRQHKFITNYLMIIPGDPNSLYYLARISWCFFNERNWKGTFSPHLNTIKFLSVVLIILKNLNVYFRRIIAINNSIRQTSTTIHITMKVNRFYDKIWKGS